MKSSIRNSIFGSLGLESPEEAQQYVKIPEAVDQETLDASDLNISRALFDVDQTGDEIADLTTSLESLREIRKALASADTLSLEEYQMVRVSVESACGRWIPSSLITPSFEDFEEKPDATLSLAMEGIGASIAAIGTLIRKAASSMVKSVKQFWADMENVDKFNAREVPLLERRMSKSEKAENPDKGRITPSGYKKLYTLRNYGLEALQETLPDCTRFCDILTEIDVAKTKEGIKSYFATVNKVLLDPKLEKSGALAKDGETIINALIGDFDYDFNIHDMYWTYFHRSRTEPIIPYIDGDMIVKAFPLTSGMHDIACIGYGTYDNKFKAQLRNLEPASFDECKQLTKDISKLYDASARAWNHLSRYVQMVESLYEVINQESAKLFRKISIEVKIERDAESGQTDVEINQIDFASEYTTSLTTMITVILRGLMRVANATSKTVRVGINFTNASLDAVATEK